MSTPARAAAREPCPFVIQLRRADDKGFAAHELPALREQESGTGRAAGSDAGGGEIRDEGRAIASAAEVSA